MLMLTIFNINDVSGVFIVNCNHISNFVLTDDFEQTNVCLVHIERANPFKDKIGHIMSNVLS